MGFAVILNSESSPEPDNDGGFRWAGAANTYFWMDLAAERLVRMVRTQLCSTPKCYCGSLGLLTGFAPNWPRPFPRTAPVIIDEIHKLPSLLNDVHGLMESGGLRFVLAASSPVKLHRGGVNLLPGRAGTRALFRFVSAEVPDGNLMRATNIGGIPSICLSPDPVERLRAYCETYLQLEVRAEKLVRGIEPFFRFLTAAPACRRLRTAPSRYRGVRPTIREYLQVLEEDTLVATLLRPFRPGSARRKPVSHTKLYFFDIGVANVLADVTHLAARGPTFGPALNQLIFCELQAWLGYARAPRPLAF